MAIIANQSMPETPDFPKGLARTVVVKFRPDVHLPYSPQATNEIAKSAGNAWDDLVRQNPGIDLKPYFTGIEESMLRPEQAAQADNDAVPPAFTSYFAIECPPDVVPDQIAATLRNWPNVETAYVEAGPTPPPLNPGDDPRNANQHYLDTAPAGIDARWAWSGELDGNGTGFVDMEQGWTLNHEDISAAGITIISGQSRAYQGHGTAVLGEVVGVDNTVGGVGIAPRSTTRVVSQWRSATRYNTAEAILSAVAAMSYGDVLLLEAQTTQSGTTGYLPVEIEQAVFDAIRYATSQGIVVVEAGANGSVDLDAFRDVNGKNILNRASIDFRDSGAIMVGAASSTVPHQRLGFSNFGSRIDCFAWGENIDTCGDGWTGTATNGYTTNFGGTSGASPIIAGAALIMQTYLLARSSRKYNPAELRRLLSTPEGNTPSATPMTDRIGVMPNLRAIIEQENLRHAFKARRWAIVVSILFGVTQDGPGIIIQPGRGPRPIGPWDPLSPQLSPEKRDLLVGLATTEVASLLGDTESRQNLNKAGITVMQQAIAKLGKEFEQGGRH